MPEELRPVLQLGAERCPAGDYIFQGRAAGRPLSTRRVELILRQACIMAGIEGPVTCMVLRHAYAIHCLERGASIRALQEALGHESVNTTMLYQRCILPSDAQWPLPGLRDDQVSGTSTTNEVQIAPAPAQPLFARPVAVTAVDLPFQDERAVSICERATSFYRFLKAQIIGRFLGLRRASPNPDSA